MDHAPKPPVLAITVFGTAGFMLAALGGFVAMILLLSLLLAGGSVNGSSALGIGDKALPEFVLMSAIGFILFRLARLIETGFGQLSAWTVVLLSGTVGLLGALSTSGLLGGLYAALLAGASLAAASLHECRDWFAYAARTERPARRRLVIRFVDEPSTERRTTPRKTTAAKRSAKRSSAIKRG